MSGGHAPQPQPLPPAPDYAKLEEEDKKKEQKRIRAGYRRRTVKTSPLGLLDQAQIEKKTLLGS